MRGAGREEAVLGPLGPRRRRNRKRRRGGSGENRGGERRRGGSRARWCAEGRECPRCGPLRGRVQAMALRLIADFDLEKDVLPWLRVQQAASAAAGARGGGPGAVGARPAGGRGRARGASGPGTVGGVEAGQSFSSRDSRAALKW